MHADPQPRRILEIGRTSHFAHLYPQRTTWLRTGAPLAHGNTEAVRGMTGLRAIGSVIRELRRGSFGLVILPAVDIRYGHDTTLPKRWARQLVRLLAKISRVGKFLSAWLRLDRAAVAIVDYSDDPAISYETCALVPSFRVYFKRELYPEHSMSRRADVASFNDRVRPITLPLPDANLTISRDTERTVDVFFAGGLHSEIRRQGIAELQQLALEGYVIDLPTAGLSYTEYLQRMCASRVVWSPEGFGWDCYRHYEALFCGAVPLINRPQSRRHLPFEDGVHCLYYDARPAALGEVVKKALSDPGALSRIAAAGRELVLAKHTRRAIAEYIERTVGGR